MKSIKSQNYYEILGVDRSASPEEIRTAYEVSKHAFQDNSLATYSLFTDEENQEILALISRAYETLFSPDLRREYDSFLDDLDREGTPTRPTRPNLQPRPSSLRPPSQRPRGTAPLRSHSGSALDSSAGREANRAAPARDRPPRDAISREPLRATAAQREPQREPQREVPESSVRPSQHAEPVVPPAEAPRADPAMAKYIESVSCFNGPVLKRIRELKGMSVEQIAERTKIRKTYIEYLEEEQFTFLPAPVYIKGFVTMIAGMLDLPAQRVAEEYMSYYRGNDQL